MRNKLRVTTFQRGISGVAAGLVALRVFFPVQHPTSYGLRTDFSTTLLQVIGILVVASALFVLWPSPRLPRTLVDRLNVAVLIAWLVFLIVCINGFRPGGAWVLSSRPWTGDTLVTSWGFVDKGAIRLAIVGLTILLGLTGLGALGLTRKRRKDLS